MDEGASEAAPRQCSHGIPSVLTGLLVDNTGVLDSRGGSLSLIACPPNDLSLQLVLRDLPASIDPRLNQPEVLLARVLDVEAYVSQGHLALRRGRVRVCQCFLCARCAWEWCLVRLANTARVTIDLWAHDVDGLQGMVQWSAARTAHRPGMAQ